MRRDRQVGKNLLYHVWLIFWFTGKLISYATPDSYQSVYLVYSRAKGSSIKSFFLRFFANIFLLVTIFLLTQRARLSGLFRYLEHVRQSNRKVSRGI